MKRYTQTSGALVESFNTFDGAPIGEWVRYQDIGAALKVIEAARWLSSSLNGGFVRCERCGDQEDTTNLDFAADLREALKEYDASLSNAALDTAATHKEKP